MPRPLTTPRGGCAARGEGRACHSAALAAAASPADTAFVMIDPRGHAMLRYGKDYEPRAARRDIDHLLRRFVSN